jgi:hypothetical protein
MEETMIQEPETQATPMAEPEKKERKRRPIKKPTKRIVRRPSAPKLPLGMLNTASAVKSEQAAEKSVSTPWKPARITEIPEYLKDPRFIYRGCNSKKTGNIQKKLQEGWEVDKELSKKLDELYGLNRTIQDGSPLDSTHQVRELIYMRMPKELALERNEYYRKRGQIDRKSIEKGMRENLNETSDPSNILGRSTIYSERKLERI